MFTRVWPLSVARLIDPELATVSRRLAGLATAPGEAEALRLDRAMAASIAMLDLAGYEPAWLRPDPAWLAARRGGTRGMPGRASADGPEGRGMTRPGRATIGRVRRSARRHPLPAPHVPPASMPLADAPDPLWPLVQSCLGSLGNDLAQPRPAEKGWLRAAV